MKFIKYTKLTVLAFLVFGLFSCSNNDDGGDVIMPTNTIADFVNENDDYSSLAAALKVTELDAILDGPIKHTVFAPNNAAFNSFLLTNGFSSLGEVPVALLTEILLNHIQKREITSGALSTGYLESMATGMVSESPLSLYINTTDGLRINGVSTVTAADIEADNGVIHAVDVVIGLPDVTTFVTADPNFDILEQALTRNESFTFVETLMMTDDPAPFTVFAPTNDAFDGLFEELEVEALEDIPTETLEATLAYHLVTGSHFRSGDLTDEMPVETLQGGEFTVNIDDDVVITDERDRTSTVIAVDVQATNGVIHALDTVLLPAE